MLLWVVLLIYLVRNIVAHKKNSSGKYTWVVIAMKLIFKWKGLIVVNRMMCAGDVSGSINGAVTTFDLPNGGIIYPLG